MTEFDEGATVGGRYEVREILEVGGYTKVHRAIDRRTSESVVIKTPNYNSFNEDVSEGFDYELRTLRTLEVVGSRTSLMQLYDPLSAVDNAFAVEYLDGSELRDVTPGSQDDLDRYLDSLIGAFQLLHQLGIVHRDLVPSNVVVADGAVTVIDFNCARPWPSCGDCGRRVRADEATREDCYDCGHEFTDYPPFTTAFESDRPVPKFKAPEALPPWENEAIDGIQGPWSDVFSLGKLFLFLLDGVAYLGTDLNPQAYRIDLPDHLAAVIRRATAADPGDRYESALELASALQKHTPVGDQPVATLEMPDGRTVTIEPGATIGRDAPGNGPADVGLGSNPKLSRAHARFEYEDGRWRLHDQSTNGTVLRRNGDPHLLLHRNGTEQFRRRGVDFGTTPPPSSRTLVPGDELLVDPDTTSPITFRL